MGRIWRIRGLPSPALVISAIALIIAVGGGSAFAIAASNTQREARIAKRVVHRLAPNLSVRHADTADTASHADSADNATNLAGDPASDYRLHCPNNLHQAADLCFDFDERAAASYVDALKTCAGAQMRLPDDGELALVFDHLGSPQDPEWTAGHFYQPIPNQGYVRMAPLLSDDINRQIVLGWDDATTSHAYRCVTSTTNSP